MEIYALDTGFRRVNPIDNYNTAIWSERYSASGDFTLTVPSTPATKVALAEKTFVGNSESDEVGIVETVLDENNMLTVTGPFLTGFLENRFVRNSRDHDAEGVWSLTNSPGWVAGEIVRQMCCSGGSGVVGGSPHLPGGALEIITNLSVGSRATGTSETIAVPFGDVYSAVKTICDTDELGFVLYPDSIGPSSYTLNFKTYRGRDLTRAQSTYPVVAFSSALDSLANVKELRSIKGYKNAAYVYAPNANPEALGAWVVGTAFVDGGGSATNFNRRTIIVVDTELSNAETSMNYTQLVSALNKRAADILANNNYVRMLDGQLVPQQAFQYGVDYLLGDVIELDSSSGIIQTARVTEYIRSQDATGYKAYPTLSVTSE